ncbi:MAG: glycoside hydrolase family 2 [Clostridia bacterium]|nr:glycoside hydrolase family 2 [Clostridia bacterium]
MLTVWGESLDKNNVLCEYPRPQLKRDSYLNLNGMWDYAITDGGTACGKYDGQILVPFSPESELSGVSYRLVPDQTLWYHRTVKLPAGFNKGRLLLNFGAVDQTAEIFINNTKCFTHIGGYTAFSIDITEFVTSDSFDLVVKVNDVTDTSHHSKGKQTLNPKGIWYTAQSGIWQTVWLESTPKDYIKEIKITPSLDEKLVKIKVISDSDLPCTAKTLGKEISFTSNIEQKIEINDFIPWTPDTPQLYDVDIALGEDRISSYFAMRKVEVKADPNGIKRIYLNNSPYFMHGLLDQGYWPDGLYTAPSDEALIYDINFAKEMGFNTLRKHIKIEPMRWYYHCDRLGMLVWQDLVNGGGDYKFMTISTPLVTGRHSRDGKYTDFSRGDFEGRKQFYAELDETINQLYNCPSIVLWTIFNEGWGQFDARKAYDRLTAIDSTRLIDHASGWHDQMIGEFKSLHVYFKKYRFKKDKLDRAVILTEFGGYGYKEDGHTWSDTNFCYKNFKDKAKLEKALCALYEKQIIPAAEQGLCADIYTQLSDVETELNGLITYDRKKIKVSSDTMRQLAKKLNG